MFPLWRAIQCSLQVNHFWSSCRELAQKVGNLDIKLRKRVLGLFDAFNIDGECGKLVGIFCTNSFSLAESESDDNDVSESGLFLTLARFNHSCCSNTDFFLEDCTYEVVV